MIAEEMVRPLWKHWGAVRTNGIVNLEITLADGTADGSSSAYELHVVYNYNAALNFARGTAEYVF